MQASAGKSEYETFRKDLEDAGYADPAHELMMAGFTNVPNDSFEINIEQTGKEDNIDSE